MTAHTVVRILTTAALAGLLFEIGLRLKPRELWHSLRDHALLARVLVLNFLIVPALALGLMWCLNVPRDPSVAILLLAAAPFAPVVPIFTKMVRGDLALAASLTALFPFVSAFFTPFVCEVGVRFVPGGGELSFSFAIILLVLLATITLPLAAGVAMNHWWPSVGRALQKPIEVIADAAGALSLGFVTWTEWEAITHTGWKPLLVTLVLSEASLVLGYALGAGSKGARRVTAFGASNRNIALAILVAIDSFAGSPILPQVVANGLLLIFVGLAHVAWWRFARPE
jgi:BASS family bile acid:Na+ symporter